MSFRLPDLSPEQRRDLRDAKRQLTAIEREILRMERAGLDVSTQKATAARYRALIEGLERELGPRRGSVA